MPLGGPDDGRTLRQRLEAQLAALEAAAAEPGIAHRTRMKLTTGIRLAIADLAKLPSPAEEEDAWLARLVTTVEWANFRNTIQAALAPYPEADAAVDAALAAVLRREAQSLLNRIRAVAAATEIWVSRPLGRKRPDRVPRA